MRAHQPIWDASDKEHIVTPFVKPLHDTFVARLSRRGEDDRRRGRAAAPVACANVAAVMLARALARRARDGHPPRARLQPHPAAAATADREPDARGHRRAPSGSRADGGRCGALVRVHPRSVSALGRVHDRRPRARLLAWRSRRSRSPLFGWAPALHAIGGDLRVAVSATDERHDRRARAAAARSWRWSAPSSRWRRCCSSAALLLVKAFDRVRHVDPGLPRRSRAARVDPAVGGHAAEAGAVVCFWKEFEQRARRCQASMRPASSRARRCRLPPRATSSTPRAACRVPTARTLSCSMAHRVGRILPARWGSGCGRAFPGGAHDGRDRRRHGTVARRRQRVVRTHVLGRGSQCRRPPHQVRRRDEPVDHRRRRHRRREALRPRAADAPWGLLSD